jgi:predicted nucleotidyltransferase
MSIRDALTRGDSSYIKNLPKAMSASFSEALSENEFPTDEDKLSTALISHFRLNTRDDDKLIFDARGGLYNRLKNASIEATDIKSLVSASETKKFTNARIKRAIWYSFFGVTSSDVKAAPSFSVILAFDKKGQALLKSIKMKSDFPLITKPSATDELPEAAMNAKRLSERADSVFQLAKPKNVSGADALRRTPFVKK